MATNLKLKIIVCLHIMFACIFITSVRAQSPTIIYPAKMDVSIPLRDMQPAKKHFWEKWKKEIEREYAVPNKFREKNPVQGIDGALQTEYNINSKAAALAPLVNFNGSNNSNNSGWTTPPDPTGDVGPNHYVETVNSVLQMFNKSGTSVYGPVATSTLWNGFTGNWSGHNDGDAIVLYDENADRWLISQFAVDCGTFPSYTEYQLVAISTTSDPTGSYYRYAFQFDYMPDYGKLAVWSDGYYMAINRFNTNDAAQPFMGAGAVVMERDKMLAGDAGARMVYFKVESLGGSGSSAGGNCYSLLPSDCDGTFPAAGTPDYFVYDDQASSELRLWALHADWTTPANSTFTYTTKLTVSAFTELANSSIVPQLGSTLKLDGLGDRMMFRNQYRNFGTYESFVVCRSVSVSSVAALRWYEYRRTGGVFSLYQQSTYAPGDGKFRWMPSIAMNAAGDIGIAYSVSNASMYPSIYFTGRKATDAINTLTVPESLIQTGAASMTGTYTRWGDYTAMNVDPSDNLTFWTTQEYVGTFVYSYPWDTKIASFKVGNPPIVVTKAASSLTPTAATLNATINPSGLATTYHFDWGTTMSYGNVTSTVSAGSGSLVSNISAGLTGLTPGTTYHFRIEGTNSDGTTYGNDLTFQVLGNAVVLTTAATSIANTSATSGGNVTSDGTFTVTARGVCWATSINPIATGSHTTDGSGTGVFTSSITGLTTNLTYHVRAYATNANGTFYGDDLTFIPGAAIVTTTAISGIASSSASCGGNVIVDGGASVTARGVCWATTANPLASGSHSTDGAGTGTFTSSITGLSSNTLYHARAYATSANGTYYGSDISFTTICPNSTLPFTESFSTTSLPSCWSQVDNQASGQVWQFGTITTQSPNPILTGNYAFLNSDAYGSGNFQNADLITPTLDLTGYATVTLAFSHYFLSYTGSSATVSYSINNGSTWTVIATYSATSATNPTNFSQAIAAVAGQPLVKFKWNYTGNWGYSWAIDNISITGTTNSWTGSTSTDWNTLGNWSTIVPINTTRVLIPTGAPRYPIVSAANQQCANLEINSGASVTIAPTGSLTVTTTLSNNNGSAGLIIKSDNTGTGSLIASSAGVNATVERYMTGSATDWHLVSSPVSGQNIQSFVTNVANNIAFISPKYGLAPYVNSVPGWKHFNTTVADPYYVGDAGNFTVGKGYEILRASNGTGTFSGTLAAGIQTIPVSAGSNNWNLIGNPFASAFSANLLADATNNFVTQNAAIFSPGYASIYVWNPVTKGYITINNATSAAAIPVGQGFFIKSVAGPVNATFPSAGRIHSLTAYTKNAQQAWPSIDVQAVIDGKSCNTQVYFIPGATTEIDEGYDAGIFNGENIEKAVYTHIEGSELGFGIQSLPGEAFKGCYVQLGLIAHRGSEVTFSAQLLNLPNDETVYLHDIFAGTSTCLSIPGNTYKVVLNDENTGIGRFYLTTLEGTVSNNKQIEDLYSVVPIPDKNILRVAGSFIPGSQVAIYDISGRILDSYTLSNDGINEFHFSPASSGIYLVRIQSGTSVINRKFTWVY